MGCVAFPLRLKEHLVDRCDPAEAVIALLGIMARTPQGSWRGSQSFGLRELLTAARDRRGLLPEVALEANRALADLGLGSIAIESIELEGIAGGEASWTVILSTGSGAPSSYSLKLRSLE
jgi:hypothetical protein